MSEALPGVSNSVLEVDTTSPATLTPLVNHIQGQQGQTDNKSMEPSSPTEENFLDALSLSLPDPIVLDIDPPKQNVNKIEKIETLDKSDVEFSMEQPFFSANRYHPPFTCPKPDCLSSKNNKTIDISTNQPSGSNGAVSGAATQNVNSNPFYMESHIEDPNRSERSSIHEEKRIIYTKTLKGAYKAYSGGAPPTRAEPKGIPVPPCNQHQKVAWWVNAHALNFGNTDSQSLTSSENKNPFFIENPTDYNHLIGPCLSILISLFYMGVGTQAQSLPSQIILALIAMFHICSFYALDTEEFHFFYHKGFNTFFSFLGDLYIHTFDAFSNNIYNYIVRLSVTKIMLHFCTEIFRKLSKQWPKFKKKPFETLMNQSIIYLAQFLEALYVAGLILPKLPAPVSSRQINHLNFRGIPQNKSKHFFPSPINKGIPVFFDKGLPFVTANIQGQHVKFLIDTGSAFNIINREIIDLLTSKCIEFPKYRHSLKLCGHSGQQLSIEENAVKLPVKFLDQNSIFSSKIAQLPFLVENNSGATNILGMSSLRKLNIASSHGFKHLFIDLHENKSSMGSPTQGSYYKGSIDFSCNTNQDPHLDFRFPDLDSYNGCILLHQTVQSKKNSNKKISMLDGQIYHLSNGLCKTKSSFPGWLDLQGQIRTMGEPVPCSHSDPGGEGTLASFLTPPVNAPDIVSERAQNLEQDSLLYDELFSSNILNNLSTDPDSDPDQLSSPLHDLEIFNQFNIEMEIPKKKDPDPDPNQNAPNYLEIQIRDNKGACFLCPDSYCYCNSEPKENTLCDACSLCVCSTNSALQHNLNNLKKKKPKVIFNHNIVTLFVFQQEDISKSLYPLSNLIIKLMKFKPFDEVKLGCSIGSKYGNDIFAKLSSSLQAAQTNCPGPPVTLIPTSKQTIIHALQFDVERGQLVHRPLMLNQTIGLEDDLLQPPEISYVIQNYDNDISEVINNSNPDFKQFLNQTFRTYDKAYIQSPTDYGELELETFQLDLELMQNAEHLLPKHKPFGTSAHITKIVAKITQFWQSINLARPSEITSHASRLLVVTKKISDRAFQKMKSEIEESTEYRFRTNNPSELYSVDPDFLTIKHINCIFRICLDSRDLNRITKDIVQRSQNPETTIYNLMLSLGGADASATKKYTWEDFRKSDPFKDTHFSTPDPDYTLIDELTKSEQFSSPRDYYYSTLDISSAHTSISLTERAKFLLNFITPSMQLFQFQRAVFGLKNISSQFNGSLCRILEDLITLGFVHVYADDVIVIAKHRQTHLALIAEIARRFHRHGLKISLGKSNFGVEKFTYLGFTFDQKGISLSQDRIDALTNFPTPKDIKGVQRFLGAVNYIQKFIPQYSFTLFPITLLLSEKEFYWGEPQEEAFQNIKKQISQNLLLHYVPAKTQLHLFVDASLVAGGGVLFCGQPGTPSYKPILYMSKKFSAHEIRKHSALEAEMHNLIYCLEKVSYFFTSLDRPVQVHTDAKTVMYLIFGARNTSNPKLARLALKLSGYLVHFNLNYTPPKCPEMQIADCISRQYYHLIPKWPGDLVKVVDKKDIFVPKPGIYDFEQLDNWAEHNKVFNEENYPEKVLKIHHIEEPNNEHFSLINLIDFDKIGQFQRKDPFVANIFKTFSPKEIFDGSPKNGYLIRHNLLYVENKLDPLFPKLYVPDQLLSTIIAAAHISFNHVGVHKHYELLNTLISNPNLKKITFDIISKCHMCQVINCDTNRKGMITGVRFPDHVGQAYSIDFMSVAKDHGFDSILVICDLFSNYCILEPCKNQTTDSAISALDRAFRYIGAPQEIRADGQQSLLKAKAMKIFLKKKRVRPEIYPPHYRFHNPVCERQIRNIRAILRTQNSLDSNFRWYKNIGNTMTVLNSIPRKFRHGGVTKFLSPFEIFFGRRKQLLKIDNYDEFPLNNARPSSLMASSLRNFTRGALLALKNDYKKAHNDKARSDIIKPGDFYLVQNNRTPQAGKTPLKYQPRYLPNLFLCKKVSGKNILGIDLIHGTANYSSIDNIKLYSAREEYFSDLPPQVKKHFGSSLDLKLSLDARKVILEKLKKLNMYKDVAKPATTLSSPEVSSSASGTPTIPIISNHKHSLSDESSIVPNNGTRPEFQFSGSCAQRSVHADEVPSHNTFLTDQSTTPHLPSSNQSETNSSAKKLIIKKLGRAGKYLNPFNSPPKKRERKPPGYYK